MKKRKNLLVHPASAPMERPDYEKNILELIRSKRSPKVMCQELQNFHAKDIAAVFPALDARERENLYRILDAEHLAEIMEYTQEASAYIDVMDFKKASQILEHMEPDAAVDILQELEPKKRNLLIELMGEKAKQTLRMLASYDEDKIASRMTTNFVAIHSTLSVRAAMNVVIDEAAEHDNISMIYVLDEHDVYYGAISLKDLIIAREGTSLTDVISTAYPYVYADEDIDFCLEILKDYSEDSIPVLSDGNQILGVITAQDLIGVVDDEYGEDYAKLAGLTAEEDLHEPVLASMKKRLPWLVLLLGLGLIVSSVVGVFENVVSQLTLIICFQSLILDMAGNVGTQSLAVTIRVLMDEKLTGRQKLSLVCKEMRIGCANGLLLGILAFAGIGAYILVFKQMSAGFAFAVSACIGISLLIAMLVSSLVGTAIPLAFHQIGVDPAVASGPLITTVNDLVAVVTYYGFTWLFLIRMLHFHT